ncbi:MAG: glutathione S-transferase N-terminal domain-containing protein [Pseudoxanthomonas sp.]
MSKLSDFPISKRWPAKHPDRIQLYSLNTPNGVKASIMLEETGLPYEAHLVDITQNESHAPEFLALNPNGKIPAIIDPQGPDGHALGLFESGAILVYLAQKSGRFLPQETQAHWHTLQWVMFQMGGLGPMFGQLGFFSKFAGKDYEDKRPLQRYVAESKRLLGVLDAQLQGRDWIVGNEYTIADIATLGWVRNLVTFYEARALVEFDSFTQVSAWLERGLSRPAVQRGLEIPSKG